MSCFGSDVDQLQLSKHSKGLVERHKASVGVQDSYQLGSTCRPYCERTSKNSTCQSSWSMCFLMLWETLLRALPKGPVLPEGAEYLPACGEWFGRVQDSVGRPAVCGWRGGWPISLRSVSEPVWCRPLYQPHHSCHLPYHHGWAHHQFQKVQNHSARDDVRRDAMWPANEVLRAGGR